jgi:type I restriction enzyme R subunit
MKFNEDSRVKIPTILNLCRLGYEYLLLRNATWGKETNVFTDIFKESIFKINREELPLDEISGYYDNISLLLENVVTELPYEKDDDTFSPDIILLINESKYLSLPIYLKSVVLN